MMFVDDYIRMKWKIVLQKHSTVEALMSFLADVSTPARLKIGIIRTYKQGEYEDRFEEELKLLEIYHEVTQPGTLHVNGVPMAEGQMGRVTRVLSRARGQCRGGFYRLTGCHPLEEDEGVACLSS